MYKSGQTYTIDICYKLKIPRIVNGCFVFDPWNCFRKTEKCFCRERKNRGRWKRSVPVVTKGIICVLSQSPNGSKSGRGEHRPQAIGKRRQAVGKRWLRRAESASVGDLQPQGCLHFNRCNDLCTELFLSHNQITCIRDDLRHQCDDSSSHHSLLEARACLCLHYRSGRDL